MFNINLIIIMIDQSRYSTLRAYLRSRIVLRLLYNFSRRNFLPVFILSISLSLHRHKIYLIDKLNMEIFSILGKDN